MEELNKNTDLEEKNTEPPAAEISDAGELSDPPAANTGSTVGYLLPLLLCVFLFMGFSQDSKLKKNIKPVVQEIETDDNKPKISLSALLAAEEFSKNLRDTVYTDKDIWIEFRIDQQRIYVHHRDGRTVTYPVSSGIPGAHKSVDSRPGLFAIFHMNEAHKSSQFNSQLNYFMAFNMGVGFHGLPGTGYYVHLGIRPSSHGCVRMRNEDVKALFKQCSIGTLVLAHKGHTNRIVAFTPADFKNDAEYTKDDYLNMLAYNLGSIMEGRYFLNPPKKFILDGTVIPKSGVNILSKEEIPEKQILPFFIPVIQNIPDRLKKENIYTEADIKSAENLSENFGVSDEDSLPKGNFQIAVGPEMVKKYVHNPLGILPYFPPNR